MSMNQTEMYYVPTNSPMQNKTYSIVPIKHTVFFRTVTVGKNTVRLIGTIE